MGELATEESTNIEAIKAEYRDRVVALEGAIRERDDCMEGDCFPLKHHFAPGVYAREIFLPAGCTIVGKIHRHEHLIIFIKGSVAIVSEEGRTLVEAPETMVSPAGVKRAVHALTDAIITTIHVTEETDLEKIEEYVIAPSFEALENENRKLSLEEKS